MISERINDEFSVDKWLRRQSVEITKALTEDRDNNEGRKLQAYRKEWLRKLIAEFEV